MAKIYTKTGDKGMTGLTSGERVSKGDLRIETYGEIDKLNSHIGLVLAHLHSLKASVKNSLKKDLKILSSVQSYLFEAGAIISCVPKKRTMLQLAQAPNFITTPLEKRIDMMVSILPELKNFILPGGPIAVAEIHVARCVCRQAERGLVRLRELGGADDVPSEILQSINRLSDYLFVLARYVSFKLRKKETIWLKS